MLRRTSVQGGRRVEFVVESSAPPSVVGDFDDPHADAFETNGYRGFHGVLNVEPELDAVDPAIAHHSYLAGATTS